MALADAPPHADSAFHRFLSKIIDVRPSEGPALAWSWLYIFSLLSSYYIMRPIRDQMGVAGGVNNLQWLFTGTLVGMLLLNLPFSYLVKTFPREKFITISYRFFSANILLFALALYAATPEQTIWVGRVFFIWTSVFNLFVVSIFWQMIVDVFTSEQGKRLFGFIAAGATLGAIAGSAFTVSTVEHMAPAYLMIGAAVMIEVAVFCVRRLSVLSAALSERPQVEQNEQPIGGTWLGGIRDALSSSYLLNVSLFLLLYAVTSTFLYFQQAAVVSHAFANRAAQTQFFASVDLGVNILTLAVQLFLTGRILKRFGVGTTLSLLPVFSVIGFGAVALLPTLSAVVAFQLIRRAGNFAIARPTREVLFTVLPREDRYKAKSFIDTAVYRLGDQIGAWSFAFLTYLKLGLTEISVVAAVASAVWLANSWWLGRRQDILARQQETRAEISS
ncbi:NTP/NDP exchange transporter [Bradyrhizobium canariense]|uniref:ATP:ADP antiporter, AAA family n=1 Tax=Bradyrhizobium canariense TaxID=255045 RepID=A0A1H1VYM5_9BRAD|nr:MFS transporter [Bradyrhizobium canariense]SDS89863.1 ATP:ADP antiporter, AAA family [Bradyrhizobium canariense]